jgi:hypothetical protein
MSGKPTPEIAVRKVRVLKPMAGEIEVTIDVADAINRMALAAAKHAYRLARGWSDASASVCAPAKAVCTPDTLITRNAHLALNNEKREFMRIELEVIE